KQAVWKRMLVTVAGATMNLILGFFLILAVVSLDSPMTSTTLAAFRENEAGESISTSSQWLQPNDRFVSINGLKIFTWQDISYALQNDTCDTFQVTVERNGQLLTYDDVTFLNTETQGLLDFYLLRDEKTPLTIISHTCKYYLTTARLIWISLVDLLSGKYGFHDLSGVVGIIDATTTVVNMSETFREKLTTMFDILGFITINVGIFNLIPFPALDGGRLVFLIVEAIRRKPCPAKVEGMIHFCGLAALMLLMVVITFQDISKIFTR
ncbi:MAG: site-2 protease family protein, partial [Oscillospiraceae bacterium]|nr:site-2 protease family protein [Oscillospiraceae bacterium]